MTRDECRMPGCDRPVGEQGDEGARDYRTSRFCSAMCDVRHGHLKADAEDARRAEMEDARRDEERIP